MRSHAYGCDLLLSELALAVCAQEGIDQRFNHLDTTSFSLSGDYVPESDEQAIAHHPWLLERPPAGLETGGVGTDGLPRWRGALGEQKLGWQCVGYADFPGAGRGADGDLSDARPRLGIWWPTAKLYHEDNAANLKQLGFITRIPNTLTLVSQVITQALNGDTWQRLDDTTRYHRIELCHYGMAQRWLVVSSQAALERAEATVSKARQRESEAIEKQLFHLQAKRFETPRGRPSRAGGAGETVDLSPGGGLQPDRTSNVMPAKAARRPPHRSRPLTGRFTPRSGLITSRLRLTSNRKPALWWGPILRRAS